jgi:hypothetical protein
LTGVVVVINKKNPLFIQGGQQRATAQSKTGIVRGCGLTEAPPVFQRPFDFSSRLV